MQTLQVHEVMAHKVDSIRESERVAVPALLKRFRHAHHLPVVDSERRVVGMLTPNDVLQYALIAGHPQVRVRELMNVPPQLVGEHESIVTAARKMTAQRIRALAVTNPYEQLVGMVTSADLLRAMAGADVLLEHAEDVPVDEMMTPDPVTIGPTASASEAAGALVEAGARHLPVVDAGGKLVGMLTEHDLEEHLHEDVMLWPDASSERLQEAVSALMSPNPTLLRSGTRVGDALDAFVDERDSAVAVVDDTGLLLGILSYVDVLRWLRDRSTPGPKPEAGYEMGQETP